MYGLELNVQAGIKCTGWNQMYTLELNRQAENRSTGPNTPGQCQQDVTID